mgnify:CR=1 FL=1
MRIGGYGFRCADAHHGAAARTAFGAHVNQPVGGFDHVQVVFNHHNRVACIAQLVQHPQQQRDVGKVKAGGRLVQDVERAPGVAFGEFQCEFDALGLAARERGGRLAQAQAAASAASSPASATVTASAPRPSGKDKDLEDKKKQAEQAEVARKKAEEEKYLKAKAENCARTRQAKASFDSGARIVRMNEKGEREILDETGRAKEMKRIQDILQSECN